LDERHPQQIADSQSDEHLLKKKRNQRPYRLAGMAYQLDETHGEEYRHGIVAAGL